MKKLLILLFCLISLKSVSQTWYTTGTANLQRTPTAKGWFYRNNMGAIGNVTWYTAPQLDSLLSIAGTGWVPTTRLISTTTPLQGGGNLGSNLSLSILQSSTSQSGYLSNSDWNTFNNKEASIATGTTLQYWRGDKTFQTLNTAAVPELTNLYYTNARGIGSTLTGYTSGAGTVSSSDNILQAIQKLNGNIGALTTGVSSVTGTTNRLTASPTSGAVVVDISASYAGQSSINTLGTIGTGTWQGTQIADAYIASAATWNAKQSALTFGTGVQAALGVNIGSTGAPVLFNGAGGIPSSMTLTNATGLPYAGLTGTVPTWNQNTTGSAAKWTTARTFWGQSADGTANISGAMTGITTLSASGTITNTVATEGGLVFSGAGLLISNYNAGGGTFTNNTAVVGGQSTYDLLLSAPVNNAGTQYTVKIGGFANYYGGNVYGLVFTNGTSSTPSFLEIGKGMVTTLAPNAGIVSLAGNIIPLSDNAIDLGSSSFKFANIYATTQAANSNNNKAATTAYVDAADILKANLATTPQTVGNSGILKSQTAAQTLITYNVPSDGMYQLIGSIFINSITTDTFQTTYTYTDIENNSRTINGILYSTNSWSVGWQNFGGIGAGAQFFAKGGTTITVSTTTPTGTGSVNYDVVAKLVFVP